MTKYDLSDSDELFLFIAEVGRLRITKPVVELKTGGKGRTTKQNAALHKYFELLADGLNEAGLDLHKTLNPSIEIPWSAELIKDLIWRPVMKAQLGKESTKDLTTKDIDKVYDVLNRHFGGKFGVSVGFPSIESK